MCIHVQWQYVFQRAYSCFVYRKTKSIAKNYNDVSLFNNTCYFKIDIECSPSYFFSSKSASGFLKRYLCFSFSLRRPVVAGEKNMYRFDVYSRGIIICMHSEYSCFLQKNKMYHKNDDYVSL